MTGQVPDIVIYDRNSFALLGVDGKNLFTPSDVGIKRTPLVNTACSRGYMRFFRIEGKELFLDKISLNTDKIVKINGVQSNNLEEGMKVRFYNNLNFKMNYSGRLLLAKDFLDEFYIHMGFQKPYAFQTVLEVSFENGNIIRIVDLSDEMKKIRKMESIEQHLLPEDIWFWVKEKIKMAY